MGLYAAHLYSVVSDAQTRLQNVVDQDTDEVLVHARMGLNRLKNGASDEKLFQSRRGRRNVRRAVFLSRCCVSNQLILSTVSEWNIQELNLVSRILKQASFAWWLRRRCARRLNLKGMSVA